MKIGIAGGSFNPIHIGHLIIIEHFREQMSLDKVIIIPAAVSPSKVDTSDEYLDAEHRLELIKNAIADNPALELDTFEIDKQGISYTIDTIRYLKEKHPNDELFLLMGEDQAIAFDKWKDWQLIAQLTQICVAPRKVYGFDTKTVNAIFGTIEKKPVIINSPLIEISSTEIRKRMRQGRSIRYLVP